MIHRCNIHCHTLDVDKMEMMGIEDKGQWMPFAIRMDTVASCKLTSLEEDALTFGCTTIFSENGDTFIIDTPYDKFVKLFTNYYDSKEEDSDSVKESPDTTLDF